MSQLLPMLIYRCLECRISKPMAWLCWSLHVLSYSCHYVLHNGLAMCAHTIWYVSTWFSCIRDHITYAFCVRCTLRWVLILGVHNGSQTYIDVPPLVGLKTWTHNVCQTKVVELILKTLTILGTESDTLFMSISYLGWLFEVNLEHGDHMTHSI